MIRPIIQVLLIEDNAADARLIRELLKEADTVRFELSHATRLSVAFDQFLKEPVDVLLLDLELPDTNGLEGLVKIREALPDLPVVVLTGLDNEKVRLQAFSLGAQDYLVKGYVDGSLLARVLRYAVERKQAEEKTLAFQQLAQSTIDSLNSNICVLDEDGTIITVNKSWDDFASDNNAVLLKVGVGSNYLAACEATQGDDRATAVQVANGIRAVMSGSVDMFELEYACHSPQENRWYMERITPLPASGAGNRKVVVSHVNITARKLAEALLTQKTAELAQFFELELELLCIADMDGNFLRVNKTWEKMLGYPSEVLEQRKFFDFVHPDDMDRTLVEMSKLGNQEPVVAFVNRYRSFDGSYRFIEWHSRAYGRLFYAAARDITERIKADTALRRQHQYLLSLQKTSLELVSQLDLDQLLENIVRRASELIGTTAGFLDLVEPETNQFIPSVGFGTFMKEALKYTIKPSQGITEIVWETGQMLVINDYDNWPDRIAGFPPNLISAIIGVPLLVDGKIVGVLGLAYDTQAKFIFRSEEIEVLNQFARLATVAIQNAYLYARVQQELGERKQAEETLRLQGAALEAAANAIAITDVTGAIQWANPAFTTLTGYPVAEAIGTNPRKLVKSGLHEDPFYKVLWDTILAGKVWYGELINRRKDGSLYTEEQTITPLIGADGEISHFIAIKQDITERKQAEADHARLLTQVREQAERIQQIMDTVTSGIVFLNQSGQVMLVNPVAERHLVSLVGEGETDLISCLGDLPLAELLAHPNGRFHEVEANGSTFVITASPLRDDLESGNWVLVINDVTEQRIAQRYQQSQEKLATIGQLAAGIAHDFNNVMSVITLYSQMLQDIPGLSPKHLRYLTQINDQASHAANLTAQILDFSRRADIETLPVDLLPLMKGLKKLLEHTLPESISLNLSYEQKNYVILADPTRLQQVLMNLALNARDAMPNSGTLYLALTTLVLDAQELPPLSGMGVGEWVHLTVSDTGTGIAPEELPHIFEPFFTTKEMGQGTGLGLAQVYGIVKQHGGFIDVQSRMGEGTVFDIYFPLIVLPAVNLSPQETGSSQDEGSEFILLVEDNEAMRLSVEDALIRMGYYVLSAANGNEALEILVHEGGEVDVVLTDLVMPKMDGLQLSEAIRQQYPDMKILIMTGHTLQENRLQTLQETAVPWLTKPFSLQTLAQKIREILDEDSLF